MKDKLFYLFFFAILLAFSRLIPHPPNFTFILASAITAPFLIKDKYYGALIPIIAMFLGDLFLGFHKYQFAVYFSILMISFFAPMKKKYSSLILFSFIGSLWFFISTNFAVWAIWDYYPKTIEGLLNCYFLAIPFFKNTLISTFCFTLLIVFLSEYIEKIKDKINYFFLILLKKI